MPNFLKARGASFHSLGFLYDACPHRHIRHAGQIFERLKSVCAHHTATNRSKIARQYWQVIQWDDDQRASVSGGDSIVGLVSDPQERLWGFASSPVRRPTGDAIQALYQYSPYLG